MNKIPQFVIKYANYKMSVIESCDGMQERFKLEKMRDITTAVRQTENAYITIDECMKIISEI